MSYKIIASTGQIYDLDINLHNDGSSITSTISSKEFLDLVINNYTLIVMTDEIKSLYNLLWDNEEQFTSQKVKNLKNNF